MIQQASDIELKLSYAWTMFESNVQCEEVRRDRLWFNRSNIGNCDTNYVNEMNL